jgi:tricorn protease
MTWEDTLLKRQLTLLVFLWIALASMAMAADQARFLTYPDIRGDKIVFSYDGDLWLTTVEGASHTRLTSHPGGEAFPKFSPDGKWIAFMGSYEGVQDVFLIPAEGGTPKRMTWLPAGAIPLTWTPDSKFIVFSSTWGRNPVSRDSRLYRVGIDGSMPELLPVDRGANCSFSEDGQRMLYVRKGNESYYWKRYKGGQYPDIWMYDFTGNRFSQVTDYVGRNAYPMWIGDTMYFSSDRDANGITNIFAQDLKSKAVRQITKFTDFDVMTPSTDRKRIVFVQSGYLYIMDPKSGTPRKIALQIPSDDWRLQDRWVNPSDYVQYVDIGNDGKSLVLDARGDVFRLALGDRDTIAKNLTGTPGVRERYPCISPDGKRVAYFSDQTGEYQIYLKDIASGSVSPLTENLSRTSYHLRWSPDGTKLLFGNRDFAVFWLDVATRKLTKVDESKFLDNDEFTWEMSDYTWSPDSRWIAYSFTRENRNNVIFLYDTLENRKVQVTDDFYDNLNPRFDADGGYLYFLSNRNYEIGMDLFEDDHIVTNPTRVMVIQLRQGEKPPFARPVFDGESTSPAKPETAAAFRIDLEGIQSRVYPLPAPPGNYFHLQGGKGYAAWSSVPEFTETEYEEFYNVLGETKWTLHIFSMKEQRVAAMDDKIAEAQVSANGERLVVRRDNRISTTSFEGAFSSKKLGREFDLSGMTYRISPREEWLQIFNDAWRWYRDFFYDQDMHGRDWKAIGEKYRAYVPEIRSRQQLNWVLSEMVGELCVSHTYVSGGDMGPQSSTPGSVLFTGLLGADLSPDSKAGLYRFDRIYGPTRYYTDIEMPLARPDIQLKEGDYLLAINGHPVRVPENYYRLLQVGKDDIISVTVGSRAEDANARTYRVKPVRNDRSARYARWVSDNIEKTLKLSDGKLGYMHVTAMGGPGIMEFDKFWRAFRYKEGLIIDVRGNGGGWTEYFLIDKLERKQVAYNVLQGMEPYRYPNPASRAQYVLLSNEDNGSDGEAFVEHFKARKLGTVVGVPSWGGLVGIVNGQRTIDNGRIEQSNNAFYGEDGKWWVENHGADPDVLQDNDPASAMAGKDLQLEKAVETALKKIKEQPWKFPPVPKYPKK